LQRLTVLSSQIQILSDDLLDQTLSADFSSERAVAENTVFQPTIDHYDPSAPGYSIRSKPIIEIEKEQHDFIKQYQQDPVSRLSVKDMEVMINLYDAECLRLHKRTEEIGRTLKSRIDTQIQSVLSTQTSDDQAKRDLSTILQTMSHGRRLK